MILTLNKYDIVIEENAIEKLKEQIESIYNGKKLFIITDQNVYDLYVESMRSILKGFKQEFVIIQAGEKSKSLQTYQEVVRVLIEKGMKKDHLLIALGGGVVGDLAGFVAGTLFRGVPFMQIPTTLLSMVDSSIGGKTGLDLSMGKNLIGVFKDPLKVIIDPGFLTTLPIDEYRNGLAEVLKAGIIGNRALYEYLKVHDTLTLNEIIQAIEVKRKIVLKDPFEKNERMLLNLGHTYGHAIESHFDYAIKHGVAISYGLVFTLEEGMKQGITMPHLYEEIKSILLRLKLIREPLLDKGLFKPLISHDKKHLKDGLHFVFVRDIEKCEIIKGVKLT